jgi:parallel beta-helix repeat protein
MGILNRHDNDGPSVASARIRIDRRVRAGVILTTLALSLPPKTATAQIPTAPHSVSLFAGTPTVPAVTVTLAPSTAALAPGATLQFAATVTGSVNTSVVWSATGGAITSSGVFTAGATSGTFAVTATLSGGTIAGSAPVTVQASITGIAVAPGQSLQAAINAAPEGATFLIKAGIHRNDSATPKNGQTFVGEAGAILSGARLLTSFTRSGAAWAASGQTQQGAGGGQCRTTSPQCMHPEDLFIDNVLLQHVGTLAEGASGKWYFDYPNDTIYIWDDPTGHAVETSVTTYAFSGTATSVTLRGLIVEKYANPAQNGAVGGGASWVVDSSEVRQNHGIGIGMADGRKVTGNKVHHNGQMGIGGSSANGDVENNEISYNNTVGYDPYWEAGGTKFTYSSNLVVRGNFVHHNDGPGLWTDINNIDVLYENNRVEDNGLSGIFHEISYRATIRNNVVSRNGASNPTSYWVDGAGILVSSSSDVEVYGNTLTDNYQGITGLEGNRGTGLYGPWLLQNLYVHNNTVIQTGTPLAGTGRTGLEQVGTSTSAFTSANNRYVANAYTLGATAVRFFWLHQNLTDTGWKSYGQDLTGTFIH